MKYIKVYLLAILILCCAWLFQTYYNYLTTNTFANVQIYWYNEDNVMILRDNQYTTLVDIDTGKKLITYNTKDIVLNKEQFNPFKNEYGLKITFTQEFLNEING